MRAQSAGNSLWYHCHSMRGAARRSQKGRVRHGERGPAERDRLLEHELNRSLHQTGGGCADNVSERRTVDVAVHGRWSVELGVVEEVESLETELQRLGFSEGNALQQSNVVIVDAGTVKEAALGVARQSHRLEAEKCGIEIGFAVAGIAVEGEPTRNILRFIDTVVVDAVGFGSEQGIVAIVEQGHGKTAAEVGDAGDRPTLCPAVGDTRQMFEGKFAGIAHYEIVLHVEGG